MMETQNLSMEAKKNIDRLIRVYHPKKIIVFGSFARGEMHPDSDLDLCIIKDNLPASGVDRKFEIYRLLTDRDIPIDLVVYQPDEFETRLRLGDPFIKTILSEGKVFYG